jgi:hypothetical protein
VRTRRFLFWLVLLSLSSLIVGCASDGSGFALDKQPIGLEMEYHPPVIPVKLTINTFGEVSFSSDDLIVIPTEIGTFEFNVITDPVKELGVENVLIIRLGDRDTVYDLYGQRFRLEFDSADYEQVAIEGFGNGSLLLEIRAKSGTAARELSLSSGCSGALGPSFEIGDRFVVPYGDGPSGLFDGPNTVPKVASILEGAGGRIIRGPICVRGQEGYLHSWYVELDTGERGWVSEGYTHSVVPWIEPVD